MSEQPSTQDLMALIRDLGDVIPSDTGNLATDSKLQGLRTRVHRILVGLDNKVKVIRKDGEVVQKELAASACPVCGRWGRVFFCTVDSELRKEAWTSWPDCGHNVERQEKG